MTVALAEGLPRVRDKMCVQFKALGEKLEARGLKPQDMPGIFLLSQMESGDLTASADIVRRTASMDDNDKKEAVISFLHKYQDQIPEPVAGEHNQARLERMFTALHAAALQRNPALVEGLKATDITPEDILRNHNAMAGPSCPRPDFHRTFVPDECHFVMTAGRDLMLELYQVAAEAAGAATTAFSSELAFASLRRSAPQGEGGRQFGVQV